MNGEVQVQKRRAESFLALVPLRNSAWSQVACEVPQKYQRLLFTEIRRYCAHLSTLVTTRSASESTQVSTILLHVSIMHLRQLTALSACVERRRVSDVLSPKLLRNARC